MSHYLEPEMLAHRLEIAILVQQRVAVLDAVGADDQIRRLADRAVGSPQDAVVSRHLNRQGFTEHRHNLEVTQLAAKSRGMRFVACASQHLQQDDVAHQKLFLTEQGAQ